MNSKPVVVGRSRRTRFFAVLAACAIGVTATAVLSGFHVRVHEVGGDEAAAASELVTPEIIGIRTFDPPSDLVLTENVTYGTRPDGSLLTLDVCSPAHSGYEPEGAGRAAVGSIHGGSWSRGDKANDDWRRVCEWLASEGFVAYSVNYRLAPDNVFPAAIDDVELAVKWMREPTNVGRFGIDPARIGALGGSAGGNLASLLGTRGMGALDSGSRVAAVAELSAPIDLRRSAVLNDGGNSVLQSIVVAYLGCQEWALCPQAANASPSHFLDKSDPPFFIGHSDAEFIPLAQAQHFVDGLDAAGIPVEFAIVPGGMHSIGILDAALRERIASFFSETLTARE